ncbi:MAG: MFS transporter [Planctomycetes bacterium]|nr:MFS transporter [Planctomycetota bacterium]
MPKRHLLVIIMFLLSMLLYVDRVCISSAKDAIAGDLSLSEKQMGWIFSAFALGYALCQVPAGLLADRFGPRIILSGVVTFWSVFTALTAAVFNLWSALVVRFLFGAGEAGAFPGCARAVYSWIPMSERGLVQGLMFSGSRFGAAFALPAVAGLVSAFGWRSSFVLLGVVGFAWAGFWYMWFRDDPETHHRISPGEKDLILGTRQQAAIGNEPAARLTAASLIRSRNVWLLMSQYFCSNFTFFFCLSWLFPFLKAKYALGMVETGLYAAVPPLAGAFGNWVAGGLVDWIYRRGRWTWSRRMPAMAGFLLASAGLIGSVYMNTAWGAVACLSVAVFGADMTIAPSWCVCIDIGRRSAGTVSGTMNMAGNLGSFVTSLAFPYLLAWTGTHNTFFVVGAVLNGLAAVGWLFTYPDRSLKDY